MKNMKKIVTGKDKEEKDRKMKTWLTVFIVVVMAASTAGFAMEFVTTESKSYNGIKFTKTDQGWQPKGFQITTSYLPQDLENLTSEGSFSFNDFNSKAYLISAPYMRNNALELLRYLPLKNLQSACLPEDENVSYCSDLPLKSCSDANPQNAIIIFTESNQTSVKYSNHCLKLEGDSDSMLKSADKALFIAYGIIK